MGNSTNGTRDIWVQIHLWLGLSLGVLGVFIGLSGSILVYDHAIDARLNPQRYALSGSTAGLAPAAYIDAASQALNGRARVTQLRMPEQDGLPVTVFARARGEGGGFLRLYLDPPSARVLDSAPGGGFIGWVHSFHENLTLREYMGRETVGLVGFAMLISSLSGLYLWWPGRGRVRQAFGTRRGVGAARNLHYLFGFYGSLVLAMLSFTGIFLAYPEPGRQFVGYFTAVSASARAAPPAADTARKEQSDAPPAKPLPPAQAIAAAQALYPQARLTGLALPAGARGAYRVNMSDAGGPVIVFVDAATGAVQRRIDAATRTGGDDFLAAQRTLHEGDAFGGPGRFVLFLGGLLPAVLAISGTFIWLRRRRPARV